MPGTHPSGRPDGRHRPPRRLPRLRRRPARPAEAGEALHAQDDAIILADEETVEMRASGEPGAFCTRTTRRPSTSSWTCGTRPTPRSNGRAATASTPCSTSASRPGVDALCRVPEVWVRHFAGAAVSIQPPQRIDDQRWVWHVGLDSEAKALLNDLYDGKETTRRGAPACSRCSGREFRNPCGHARAGARPPGVPGLGDDPGAAPQAQAARPADQPAARPAA